MLNATRPATIYGTCLLALLSLPIARLAWYMDATDPHPNNRTPISKPLSMLDTGRNDYLKATKIDQGSA